MGCRPAYIEGGAPVGFVRPSPGEAIAGQPILPNRADGVSYHAAELSWCSCRREGIALSPAHSRRQDVFMAMIDWKVWVRVVSVEGWRVCCRPSWCGRVTLLKGISA